MVGVTVVIQAAGEPTEGWWGMAMRKQMVPIAGEPLVVRTQRQCVGLDYQPVIVSNHLEILAVAKRSFVPSKHGTYLETFLSTQELWKGWVIVLLGDVVWSDQALSFALEQRESPLFIAAPDGNVHAWMFHERDGEMLAEMARALIGRSRPVIGDGGIGATIIDLYRQLGAPTVRFPSDGGITRDFDRDVEYQSYLEEHVWAR